MAIMKPYKVSTNPFLQHQ